MANTRLTTFRDIQRIETMNLQLLVVRLSLTTFRDIQRIETRLERCSPHFSSLTTFRDIQRIETLDVANGLNQSV